MRKEDFFEVLGDLDGGIVEEARMPMGGNASGKAVRTVGWIKCVSMAACFCLIFMTAALMLPGILKGPRGVTPPSDPGSGPAVGDKDGQGGEDPSQATAEPDGTNSRQLSDGQNVIIDLGEVVVNESEGMAPDYALRYYDPDIYAEETWGEDEVVAYYGWNLVPEYIPGGLSDGGQGVAAGIVREKATGKIVQEQVGRSFWPDFWEDGSPKSGDDIVIPAGFTVRASRLGILHCALLPVDGSEATDFGGVPVTISHCSLPHGPFDSDRKDPSGLYNMPAGYYDIYAASFAIDGVKYEIEAQRLELEEVVRIIASIVQGSAQDALNDGCAFLAVFNDVDAAPVGVSAMISLVADDFCPMSAEESLDYFGVALPENGLLPDIKLIRSRYHDRYGVYRSEVRGVYYDINSYEFIGLGKSVTLTLHRLFNVMPSAEQVANGPERIEFTKIRGWELTLFRYVDEDGIQRVYTEFVLDDVTCAVSVSGLDDDELALVLTGLLPQKESVPGPATATGIVTHVDSRTEDYFDGAEHHYSEYHDYITVDCGSGTPLTVWLPSEAGSFSVGDSVTVTYNGEPTTAYNIWPGQLVSVE